MGDRLKSLEIQKSAKGLGFLGLRLDGVDQKIQLSQ